MNNISIKAGKVENYYHREEIKTAEFASSSIKLKKAHVT